MSARICVDKLKTEQEGAVIINYDYATVSEAINELIKQGYSVDFNLPDNITKFETGEYNADDFEVRGVYRYEGDSDPGDEAIVYAIRHLRKIICKTN